MKKLQCYMSSEHMKQKNNWLACIDDAAQMGFDGVELFAGEGDVDFMDLPEEKCMAVAARAKEKNLALSVHPWVDWDVLEEGELVRRYRRLIERCAKMGARYINMHLHFLANRRQGMHRVFEATDPCLDLLASEQMQMVLLYENVPEHGAREPGSETTDFEHLFEHYGLADPIRMNIDCGHAHIMHEIAPLSQDYADRWCYTHINDNDGLEDIHVRPGAGTVDFAALAAAAKNADYSGILMMEYPEDGLKEGMPVLTEAYRRAGFLLTNLNL